MNIKDLESVFAKAKETGAKFVAVQIYTRGNERPELIVNQKESFDNKLEYYKKAYNDDLVLKTYDGICIKGIAYGDNLDEIEDSLINYHDDFTFGFGKAIQYLKKGKKIARKGWNGKGMFIYFQDGSTPKFEDLKEHLKEKFKNEAVVFKDGNVIINPHIDMKAADGSITIGWAPSQIDMLAEDWEVV